ncbi:MAG: MSMEG_0570 family nitrogen starvation response protein [Planctomycetota bacterium]
MPSVRMEVRWPDDSVTSHISPSTIIKKYFQEEDALDLSKFVEQAEAGFEHANRRVQERFGFVCSQATGELNAIKRVAKDMKEGSVKVLSVAVLD